MKRKKFIILSLIVAILSLSSCEQKRVEGEPDVISSMKTNQDERLIIIANRNQINNKEDFAEYLIKKCKENTFKTIKFSIDYGYATSLYLSVYLWEDQVNGREPVMVVEYLPDEWGQEYDIFHDPEKFQMYIEGKLTNTS